MSGADLAATLTASGWDTVADGPGWARMAPPWNTAAALVVPLDPMIPGYARALQSVKESVERMGDAALRPPASRDGTPP
jgi:hypothetical protein